MLDSRYKHIFLLPALLALVAIIIFPLIYTVRLSLSGWDVNFPELDYIGWDNYARAITDGRFWDSMGTLYLMVLFCVVFEYLLGFALALMLWKDVRAGRFFRVLFIVPMCVTPVVMAVVWRTIFHETLGPLNDVLSWFGIPGVPWLSKSGPAFAAVVIIDVWQWTSFMFILLLAGLMSLPREPYEAAQIDGAGPIRTFVHVTFPLMAPITLGALIIRLIESSKLMETIYALTSGGPGSSTETTSYLLYIRGLARISDRLHRLALDHLSRDHDHRAHHLRPQPEPAHDRAAGAGAGMSAHEPARERVRGIAMSGFKADLYRVLKYAALIAWAIFVVAPFLWALSTSFKSDPGVVGGATYIPFLEYEPTVDGWTALFRDTSSGGISMQGPYLSSLVVSLISTSIALFLGTLAAYGLSRFTFRAGPLGNNDITFFFISQRIMPPAVLAIPYFLLLRFTGLLDTHLGLILVYVAMLLPIVVWVMVDFFNTVPIELDEAALIDGCNPIQAFYRIILPNCAPGMVVATLLCIIFSWSDFFFALTLTFAKVQLLPPTIVILNSNKVPWWSLSASALVSVLPLVIIAFVLERYLARGTLAGVIRE